MKVLIKEEEKASYVYKDIPVPQPGKGELLVKILKVSICGSDTILYEWNEGMTIPILYKFIKHKFLCIIEYCAICIRTLRTLILFAVFV